ncbi:MAG: hypothetical protein KGY74_10825, partial [Candidatus Cloacimonetes bacterium]|nr:hypothetical protein [Candidatus Cloacimonadota bacterium]
MTLLFFNLNAQTNVGSLLDLYNVRDNLSGTYNQTIDIDLIPTYPDSVESWTSGTYDEGAIVKNGSPAYTYICTATTTTQEPPGSDWKQLWETSKGWNPIGDGPNGFTGLYNGKGYKISNVYINRPDEDFVGIFGCMTGTSSQTARIDSVIIEKVDIKGRSGVGSLLGKINDNRYVIIDR